MKRKIRRISIFDEFQCVGQRCSINCCQGWKIPINHDVYMKYLHEKGLFGTKLRVFLKRGEQTASFRSPFGRCPFWGRDRLCNIQKKRGEEYMPAVCVQFPRQLYNLSFFCEETLYLACPEAVKLFLACVDSDKPFEYHIIEDEPDYEVNTTNDDKNFLDYLVKSREELTGMLRNGMNFDSMAILAYGKDAQDACLNMAVCDYGREGQDACLDMAVSKHGREVRDMHPGSGAFPSPLDYSADGHYEIGIEKINKLFFEGFYHPNLRVISNFLHKLCKKYIREIGILGRLNPGAADKKLLSLQNGLYQKLPELDKILNRYFEYYLLTNFLDIYEDYSLTKCLLYGIVKTKMVALFLALYAQNKDTIGKEEIAAIIAVYERRAPQMKDALKKL